MTKSKKVETGKSAALVFKAIDDFDKAMKGADLLSFVKDTLFPELRKLRDGGRAAIIIKNTVLSNTDNASVYVRKMLIEKCQLEWVLDLPQKVFAAGVKAVVLFFRKGGLTTQPINYYELDLGDVSLGKTRPLKEEDLVEFEALAKGNGTYGTDGTDATDGTHGTDEAPNASRRSRIGPIRPTCPTHWTVDPAQIDRTTYDLSVKNPNRVEEKPPTVEECRTELKTIFADLAELVKEL